jgi:hypothetical protein
MRRVMVLLLIAVLFLPVLIHAQVRVDGYYRKDGTYVQPHYRSNPDGNPYNNWSTRGNVNPYTGQPGYRDPASLNSWHSWGLSSGSNSDTFGSGGGLGNFDSSGSRRYRSK